MEDVQVLQPPDQDDAVYPRSQRAGKSLMSRLTIFLSSEQGILGALPLAFLPWLAVSLYTGGWWSALNLLGYALLVCAVGYGIVGVALPAATRNRVILVAP